MTPVRDLGAAVFAVLSSVTAAASCSGSSAGSDGGGPSTEGGSSSSGGSSGSSSSSSGGGSDASTDAADGPSGDGCSAYVSDADLTAPVVSFQNDVLPIFEHACGLSSSCHGDLTDIGARGIFLGCDMSTSMSCIVSPPVAPQVYPRLVAADAAAPLETTSMPFITPGDPTMSYLMHKVDGDQCTVPGCVAHNAAVTQALDTPGSTSPGVPGNWCGTSMPFNVSTLDPSWRDTIRRWIKQGAMNN